MFVKIPLVAHEIGPYIIVTIYTLIVQFAWRTLLFGRYIEFRIIPFVLEKTSLETILRFESEIIGYNDLSPHICHNTMGITPVELCLVYISRRIIVYLAKPVFPPVTRFRIPCRGNRISPQGRCQYAGVEILINKSLSGIQIGKAQAAIKPGFEIILCVCAD